MNRISTSWFWWSYGWLIVAICFQPLRCRRIIIFCFFYMGNIVRFLVQVSEESGRKRFWVAESRSKWYDMAYRAFGILGIFSKASTFIKYRYSINSTKVPTCVIWITIFFQLGKSRFQNIISDLRCYRSPSGMVDISMSQW